jgi:hypothetical protein
MADKNIGGLWEKRGGKGTWFSGNIEIDGVKHYFVAFRNDFKKEGDNAPDYRILPPKPKEDKQASGTEEEIIPF